MFAKREEPAPLDVPHESTEPKYSESKTMKAVVYHGSSMLGGKRMAVENHARPQITHEKDVIVKVELTSISGSDIGIYTGQVPVEKGTIVGHEAVGVVQEAGAGVDNFKRGDRVVVPMILACGECDRCKEGHFAACDATNDSPIFSDEYGGSRGPAAVFGHSKLLGNMPGCQAEFVRVPLADANLFLVPEGVSGETAVLASDVATTGLHAAVAGRVKEGDTVAIWGLGPLGLMAGYWCKKKGAKRIIGIDRVSSRLVLAHDKLGFEVLDRSSLSSKQVVGELFDLLQHGQARSGGVDVAIGAARIHTGKSMFGKETEASCVFKEMATCVRKCGHLVLLGDIWDPVDQFPLGHIAQKHVTVHSGLASTHKYMPEVLAAMEAGEIDADVVITHRMPLHNAPEAYDKLTKTERGFIKVALDTKSP